MGGLHKPTTQKQVFAPEFKFILSFAVGRETVALLESSGKPLARVAAEVGIRTPIDRRQSVSYFQSIAIFFPRNTQLKFRVAEKHIKPNFEEIIYHDSQGNVTSRSSHRFCF